jgi:hypothetical protein
MKGMKSIRKIFILCLIFVVVSAVLRAEEPLASKELIQALTDEVSGERVFDYLDIAQAFSAEYGAADPQMVYAFFKISEKAGLIAFK